jgi:beta-aspartyl-dipeptidase (metallo-type)
MILIKNARVYAPESLGIKDILIEGGKIAFIGDNLRPPGNLECRVLEAGGKYAFPGLVDAHVHIAGAGGEGGPETRTPEIQINTLVRAGITTVVGCLGTDGITRPVESVLMKVKAIRAQGLSAWMYTGAYQVPTPTITGEVGRDLALIDEVIGAGEIALSDHRSSTPTTAELIRLVAQVRVGAMLGGKAGLVNIHMGDARDPFRPIHDAVAGSELGYKQFYPTHCNRNAWIFEDALDYGKKGWIDLTSSSYPYFPDDEVKPSRAMKALLDDGVPLGHITMSSDAHGSLPGFDGEGNLVRLEMGMPDSLLAEVRDALDEGVELPDALSTVTRNPASLLKLSGKGRIGVGTDADLILVNDAFEIEGVIGAGTLFMDKKENLIRGYYE